MGRELSRATPAPAALLTSPIRRARQTAAGIARTLATAPQIVPDLAPGAQASQLLAAVVASGQTSVAVVGHQPDLSHIAVALIGNDPGFAPGAIHAVDVD